MISALQQNNKSELNYQESFCPRYPLRGSKNDAMIKATKAFAILFWRNIS